MNGDYRYCPIFFLYTPTNFKFDLFKSLKCKIFIKIIGAYMVFIVKPSAPGVLNKSIGTVDHQ